jgi:hypothetical protein
VLASETSEGTREARLQSGTSLEGARSFGGDSLDWSEPTSRVRARGRARLEGVLASRARVRARHQPPPPTPSDEPAPKRSELTGVLARASEGTREIRGCPLLRTREIGPSEARTNGRGSEQSERARLEGRRDSRTSEGPSPPTNERD